MLYWLIFSALFSVLLVVLFRKLATPSGLQLRVLMYHKISGDGSRDFLTVPVNDLEAQFRYLQAKGYTPILLSDLVQYVQQEKKLPPDPVLLTFDDGYRDNFTVMYPLLEKFGMKANIFLVPSYLANETTGKDDQYLHLQDLQAMDPALVEFGLHSYHHKSYKELSQQALHKDLVDTKDWLTANYIPFQPCLAFPYGAYPKRRPERETFFETLRFNNIILAFRIGNRLNPLPLRRPLLVQRLDIRGDDPFEKFERLLLRGKQ